MVEEGYIGIIRTQHSSSNSSHVPIFYFSKIIGLIYQNQNVLSLVSINEVKINEKI